MHSFFRRLLRKKVLSDSDLEESNLKRCLTTFDLIGLGIGSTLGAGLYVIGGQVAQKDAGPAVVLSFFIAAVASALAGICYAEFAARIPRAGSAYVYSYVTVGELMAFVIGWNLVLEYVIGTASVARGWSGYFDAMIDKKLSKFFNRTMPMHIDELSEYPDFFAFGITILITALLAFGVKESARINNIFTGVNLMIVLYVIICGLFKLDSHNWNLRQDEVPSNAGTGGFMPYGFSKMMQGAATCFYAFVGFDCVATTGEETKNPQRAIPIAIVVSLFIIFLSYCGVSVVITLMCPYYLIDPDAPLPFVFDRVGWGVARYIISVGAMCGLSTSLLGGMFPLPRILYAMAGDGVIFRFMGKVSPRFKTPVIGTAISGIFAGLMAMFFNLGELVDMMSIGTLLAYTLVCVSVLILRYEVHENLPGNVTTFSERERLMSSRDAFTFKRLLRPGTSKPTVLTSYISKWTLMFYCVFIVGFASFAIFGSDYLEQKETWAIVCAILLAILPASCFVVLCIQPQSEARLAFKVPLVPFLPALSVLINVYLMLKLSPMTWVRFGVWMAIGMAIYFFYGVCYNVIRTPETPQTLSRSDSSTEADDVKLIKKEDR